MVGHGCLLKIFRLKREVKFYSRSAICRGCHSHRCWESPQDGIIEAMDSSGEQFGLDRVKNIANGRTFMRG
jgi:hypothetical protein